MKKTSRPSRTARCAVSPVRVGECLDRLAADADQHPAPVVFTRQPPDGRPEHIVLPAVGVGEEAAALQRIGQPEDAARVDAEDLRQPRQRHGIRRSRHRFQERQRAFHALHRRRLHRASSDSGGLFAFADRSGGHARTVCPP